MENREINIEEIMDGIKAEIKEKGYTADMLSFEDVTKISVISVDGFDQGAFSGIVSYMNSSYTLPISKPVAGNRIKRFIKKILRKIARFMLRPVVEHQSEYNCYSAKGFAMLEDHIKSVNGKVALLEAKLESSEKEITELKAKIAKLESEQSAK